MHGIAHSQADGGPLLFEQGPAEAARRVIVALAVATVLHRKRLSLEQLLNALEEQFYMPTCLIETHDLLITPLFLGPRGDYQDPS